MAKDKTQDDGLPRGWGKCKLSAIATINKKPSTAHLKGGDKVSFVPMASVEALTGKMDASHVRELSEVQKGFTSFIEGDILFAKITPCMENGKIAIAPALSNGVGFGSTEFHTIRPADSLPCKYIFHFLIQEGFRRSGRIKMTGSAGQLRVPKSFLEDACIPLPPFAEQERIVAKIEELFSDLDKGVETLKGLQGRLKVYRQAVLKYAFEGKLTEKWRKENAGRLEPAEKLLERIAQERENVGKGKAKKLSPLTKEELAKLPELPEGWERARIGLITDALGGYAFKSKEYTKDGFQIIKIGNVNQEGLDLSARPCFIALSDKRIIDKYLLQPGDILITLTGTRRKRDYGFVGMVNGEENLLLNQRLARLRCDPTLIPKYILLAMGSEPFRDYFFKNETGNVGQGNVGMPAIVNSPIPFPSLQEQAQIVAEIESRLSICDKMEEAIEASLKKVESLRQSILKKAFEGRLVAQNPKDEPAEKLLERIAKERSTPDQGSKKRSTK